MGGRGLELFIEILDHGVAFADFFLHLLELGGQLFECWVNWGGSQRRGLTLLLLLLLLLGVWVALVGEFSGGRGTSFNGAWSDITNWRFR